MSNNANKLKNRVIFHGFFTAGLVMGPLLGAFLFSHLDATYLAVFQISAVILAAGIIMSLRTHGIKTHLNEMRFSPSSLKWITKSPLVVLIVLYCSSCFGIMFNTHPAFLNDNSLKSEHIEILYFVFGVSRIVTLLNADRLSKRSNYTMIAATATIAMGMIASFWAGSFIEFMFAMMLLGFGISIFLPLALEILLSKTQKSARGIVIGTYEAIYGIGWVTGSVVAGVLSHFYGILTPYPVFFAIGAGIAVLALIKRKSLCIDRTG